MTHERLSDIKVLLSAYTCAPGKGSETGNSWHWARNLVEQGHDVWVLTHDHEGTVDPSVWSEDHDRLTFVFVPVPRWVRALKGQIGIYLRYLVWQRYSFRRAKQLDREHAFDVVHHVSWGSLVWGSPLWRLGPPFVFGPAGGGQVFPEGFRAYLQEGWKKEMARTMVTRYVLPYNPRTRRTMRKAQLVLTPNRETLTLMKRMGAERVHLSADTAIPPGYSDGAKARNLAPNETLRIIWIARLYPIKGLLLALEALSSVRDLPWHLRVVGGGPLAASLPTWLEELGIQDRVEVLGQIPWAEVKRQYDDAHIMLFTSLRESMGAQMYEALGCGLPVVTLSHQGARDMVPDDSSMKVELRSPRETVLELGRAIKHIVENPEMVKQMSHAALRFAEHNGWRDKVRATYGMLHLTDQR